MKDPETARRLAEWYARAGRELPWRGTGDPYLVWLSEVILQQTRVAQGWGYYERFAARFPSVGALAAAPADEVMRLWQGLGYYTRARNLHAAARRIVDLHGGVFPRDHAAVRALPGVGDYTAAAVCSIAFGQPRAAVDGNVHRVLARLYDLPVPTDTPAGRGEFRRLAQALLDERAPGAFNQAMMDFGALCCTPAAPRCAQCPLEDRCLARAAGTVGERPLKSTKKPPRERFFHYFHINTPEGGTWLRQRTGRDIWRGLWEFPGVETEGPASFGELAAPLIGARLLETISLPPHRLTHQLLRIVVHRIGRVAAVDGCLEVAAAEIDEYALPRPLDRYLRGR